MGIYDYEVLDGAGKLVSLKEYEGKVLLIVNSATECGFTPQYDELRDIHDKFEERGFSVLDFPCNQFGAQAPGSNEEIQSFCSLKFGIKYPIFSKIDVNGTDADPLFQYLKSKKGFEGFDLEHPSATILDGILSKADENYKNTSDIKWNFTKFLIDTKGQVVARFEPTADLKKVEEEIAKLL